MTDCLFDRLIDQKNHSMRAYPGETSGSVFLALSLSFITRLLMLPECHPPPSVTLVTPVTLCYCLSITRLVTRFYSDYLSPRYFQVVSRHYRVAWRRIHPACMGPFGQKSGQKSEVNRAHTTCPYVCFTRGHAYVAR